MNHKPIIKGPGIVFQPWDLTDIYAPGDAALLAVDALRHPCLLCFICSTSVIQDWKLLVLTAYSVPLRKLLALPNSKILRIVRPNGWRSKRTLSMLLQGSQGSLLVVRRVQETVSLWDLLSSYWRDLGLVWGYHLLWDLLCIVLVLTEIYSVRLRILVKKCALMIHSGFLSILGVDLRVKFVWLLFLFDIV